MTFMAILKHQIERAMDISNVRESLVSKSLNEGTQSLRSFVATYNSIAEVLLQNDSLISDSWYCMMYAETDVRH